MGYQLNNTVIAGGGGVLPYISYIGLSIFAALLSRKYPYSQTEGSLV